FQVASREKLFNLIFVLAVRHVYNQVRHANSKKEAPNRYREADLDQPGGADAGDWLSQVASREPTPEMLVQAADECDRLLSLLSDDCRDILRMHLEGLTQEEVAEKRRVNPSTISRKLTYI